MNIIYEKFSLDFPQLKTFVMLIWELRVTTERI